MNIFVLPLSIRWIEFPKNLSIYYGEIFAYSFSNESDFEISEYSINDTTNFQINKDGLITNSTFLEIGNFSLEISISDILVFVSLIHSEASL